VNVLVCVKRVPATGSRITLTQDEQRIDTTHLGFTISPHEECAVEEAVRLVEANGGTSVVLTLGPAAAEEQLRDALAIGVERGILLGSEVDTWDAVATADAIVQAVREEEAAGTSFDLLLFGNEAADSGDHQVGVRVAYALGLPCVAGVRSLEVADGSLTARRGSAGGEEVFDLQLPAVVSVKEGINLPRFPSVPGRIKAKKKDVAHRKLPAPASAIQTRGLRIPVERQSEVQVLGQGADAAPEVVDLLERLGVVER
jgi:electron transfer flavoprotein beta subunit